MRIAQVAPLAESVPPRLYGGTERVVSWLTEELLRQGHEVSLFASGDSLTNAPLCPLPPPHRRGAPKKKTGSISFISISFPCTFPKAAENSCHNSPPCTAASTL